MLVDRDQNIGEHGIARELTIQLQVEALEVEIWVSLSDASFRGMSLDTGSDDIAEHVISKARCINVSHH